MHESDKSMPQAVPAGAPAPVQQYTARQIVDAAKVIAAIPPESLKAILEHPEAPPPSQPPTAPAAAWESEFPLGWTVGYKADMRDNTSRAGVPYTLFIFACESGGRRGRYAYYLGHHRAAEAKALRLRLATNPYCWVLVARKPNVSGLVIDGVDCAREVPPTEAR